MTKSLTGLLLLSLAGVSLAQSPPAAAGLELWRLDCGSIEVDLSTFSDTGLYRGERRTLAASCYLIRNGNRFLLWDTGIDGATAGKPRDAEGNMLRQKVLPQLAQLGVKARDVTFVGISHYHFDHTGQAADFPAATLLIGEQDLDVVKSSERLKARFGPWLQGGGTIEAVDGDKDVFGDGRVIMLRLPGHTPGHSGLLVRLASGPVLLSGDQYHFTEQVPNRGVPAFNTDRADTLASHDRFERLARNLGARVIIQHEPADVAKLPPFPQAAR